MISFKRTAMVVTLALAGMAIAQEQADQRRLLVRMAAPTMYRVSRTSTALLLVRFGAQETGSAVTSRPLSVPVQIVIVSDDNGGHRARVTPTRFARWIRFANGAFRKANIEFTFHPQVNMDYPRSTIR